MKLFEIYIESIEILKENIKQMKQSFKQEEMEDYGVTDEKSIENEINRYTQQFNFLKSQNRIQNKQKEDPNYWKSQGFDKFKMFIDDESKHLKDTTRANELSKNLKINSNNAITVYSSNKIDIVVPLDARTSHAHGKDTTWCTAKITQNMFSHHFYNNEDILIYVIEKGKSGNKWAIRAGHDGKIEEVQDKMQTGYDEEKFKKDTGMNAQKIVKYVLKHFDTDIKTGREDNRHKDIFNQISNLSGRDENIELQILASNSVIAVIRYAHEVGMESLDEWLAGKQLVKKRAKSETKEVKAYVALSGYASFDKDLEKKLFTDTYDITDKTIVLQYSGNDFTPPEILLDIAKNINPNPKDDKDKKYSKAVLNRLISNDSTPEKAIKILDNKFYDSGEENTKITMAIKLARHPNASPDKLRRAYEFAQHIPDSERFYSESLIKSLAKNPSTPKDIISTIISNDFDAHSSLILNPSVDVKVKKELIEDPTVYEDLKYNIRQNGEFMSYEQVESIIETVSDFNTLYTILKYTTNVKDATKDNNRYNKIANKLVNSIHEKNLNDNDKIDIIKSIASDVTDPFVIKNIYKKYKNDKVILQSISWNNDTSPKLLDAIYNNIESIDDRQFRTSIIRELSNNPSLSKNTAQKIIDNDKVYVFPQLTINPNITENMISSMIDKVGGIAHKKNYLFEEMLYYRGEAPFTSEHMSKMLNYTDKDSSVVIEYISSMPVTDAKDIDRIMEQTLKYKLEIKRNILINLAKHDNTSEKTLENISKIDSTGLIGYNIVQNNNANTSTILSVLRKSYKDSDLEGISSVMLKDDSREYKYGVDVYKFIYKYVNKDHLKDIALKKIKALNSGKSKQIDPEEYETN